MHTELRRQSAHIQVVTIILLLLETLAIALHIQKNVWSVENTSMKMQCIVLTVLQKLPALAVRKRILMGIVLIPLEIALIVVMIIVMDIPTIPMIRIIQQMITTAMEKSTIRNFKML